jgi:rhamnogalacturonyl hydrolase YesR
MKFAEHAIRATPATSAPRNPWWIDGGYGARFWQDDLYMVVPWLALYPDNELARNLAYEWIEAYAYDHRDGVMASSRSRKGTLLWDETSALFRHDDTFTTDFWGRGNGWAVIALTRAQAALDGPYTGGRYDQVVGPDEIRAMLRASAASLVARRTPDGGWGSFLSNAEQCPVAETSATALLTFFLARGVNEGWLDRDVYTPIVLRAFTLLTQRVDSTGVVRGIQPPGIGPACATSASDDAVVNLNYGPGAFLLAASEVLKFPDDVSATASPNAALPASPLRAPESARSIRARGE